MTLSALIPRARSAIRQLTGFARRSAQDAELEAELEFHIDEAAARNVRSGMTPSEARRQALVTFGGHSQWTESTRDEQRSRVLDDFARDLRYGVAGLRRNASFSAGAMLTTALAIAAVATVFNFVSAVYLRRLPVPEGDRLVLVHQEVTNRESTLGYPAFERLRERTKTLDIVVAHYSTSPLYMSARSESGEVPGAVVSADYFRMLGLRPALGRFFVPSEDSVRERDAVAVLGYGMWQSRFGADSQVVGEHITLNGRAFTVIGVAPDGFDGIVGGLVNNVWIPMAMLRTGYRYCDGYQFSCPTTDILARLAPGVTLREAQAEARALRTTLMAGADSARMARQIRVEHALGIRNQEQFQYKNLSRLLWAIAIVLMLVACANLGGLLLARGITRQREFALRSSLGASRWRIVRQLLAESLILGVGGGVAGVALTIVASRVLADFFATDVRRIALPLDGRVVGFAAVATILMVLLFGLYPALRASKVDVSEALKTGSNRASHRARFVLVVGQAVLAVTLLSAAGLLSRSFARAMAGSGFDASRVALVRLRPAIVNYSVERSMAYFQLATERIRAVPGVVEATPMRGYPTMRAAGGRGDLTVALPGAASATADAPRVFSLDVGPQYFAAFRVPLVAGREFSEHDTPATPLVTIIDDELARRLWGSTDVIGRYVMFEDGRNANPDGANSRTFQVVGVVKDHRQRAFGEAVPPLVYVAFWQMPFGSQRDARMVVRVEGDPVRALASIRRAADSADPVVPVTEPTLMDAQMRRGFAEVRLGGIVLSASAALTLTRGTVIGSF